MTVRMGALLLLGALTLGLPACGSDDNSSETTEGGPDTVAAGDRDLEDELAEISGAAQPGLSESLCEEAFRVVSQDADSPEQVANWFDDLETVEIELRSRVAPAAEPVLDRWLEIATANQAARSDWFALNSSSDRHGDLSYQNPLGVGASERREAQRDDAWLRLYLAQACWFAGDVPETEQLPFDIASFRWSGLRQAEAVDFTDEQSSPADHMEFAGIVLDTFAQQGLSGVYAEHGSAECQAVASDPLVAHALDLWTYAALLQDATTPGVAGVRVYGDQLQFEDATNQSDTSGLNELIPIVTAGEGFKLDDPACYAPQRPQTTVTS